MPYTETTISVDIYFDESENATMFHWQTAYDSGTFNYDAFLDAVNQNYNPHEHPLVFNMSRLIAKAGVDITDHAAVIAAIEAHTFIM